MRSTVVLVIAGSEQSSCVRMLDEMGFIPLVRREMQEALDTLRREPFAAICIDGGCERIDVLECILNIRDVDARTPVLVVHGNSSDHFTRLLAQQPDTYLVRECAGLEDAAPAGPRSGPEASGCPLRSTSAAARNWRW